MQPIYYLQEFSPIKIATGQINPNTVSNIKYLQYPTGSNGMLTINSNTELDNYRKMFSVYTSKTTWSAVKQTINTNFTELQTNSIPYKLLAKEFENTENLLESTIATTFSNPTITNSILNSPNPGQPRISI